MDTKNTLNKYIKIQNDLNNKLKNIKYKIFINNIESNKTLKEALFDNAIISFDGNNIIVKNDEYFLIQLYKLILSIKSDFNISKNIVNVYITNRNADIILNYNEQIKIQIK